MDKPIGIAAWLPDTSEAGRERVRRVLVERIRYEAFCRIMDIAIKYWFPDGFHEYR